MTSILTSLGKLEESDERLLEEGVVSTLDFLFLIKSADAVLPDIEERYLSPGTDLEKIYNFFVANNMSRGSAIKRAIDMVCELSETATLSVMPNFSRLLNKKIKEVTFKDFKQAFFNHLKEEEIKLLVCLDDIDGIGFAFAPSDRLFIDSIIALEKWTPEIGQWDKCTSGYAAFRWSADS